MASNDKNKLKRFLELQEKGIKIEEIANKLNIELKELRRFLNKNGYKSVKGKYKLKEDNKEAKETTQLELTLGNNKSKSSTQTKASNTNKKTVLKKSKSTKVNMTVEDMDKLCEVYDWYLSIKDLKTLQSKKRKATKDLIIEECDMSNLKSVSIKVEKSTWEEFERLCSNSEYKKQEILTQALKNFLKENKNLL